MMEKAGLCQLAFAGVENILCGKEELLHKLGVYHYDQIAGWNEMNLRWIDQHLGSFRGRAFRDKWIEQSSKLASGWRPSNKDGDKPV